MQLPSNSRPQGQGETTLDKMRAAQQQVEAAMGLFTTGLFGAATTLAYAAENCVPKQDAGTMFRLLVKCAVEVAEREKIERFLTEQKAKREFNLAPRWLRHNDVNNIDAMPELDVEAFAMIYRAISALRASYGESAITATMYSFIAMEGHRLTMEDGKLVLLPPVPRLR